MDILLSVDPYTSTADFMLTDEGDLALDYSLATAISISLFSDARSDSDDPMENDQRGWWAESIGSSGVSGDHFGSHLWLLARAKNTIKTIHSAESYIRKALDWMVEDQEAKSFNVTVEKDKFDTLIFTIDITLTNGRQDNYSISLNRS